MTWVERLALYVIALAVGAAVVVGERWLGLGSTLVMVAIGVVVVVAATTELERSAPRAEEPGAATSSSAGGVRPMGDRRSSNAARAGGDE